ncbi:MAG TPA: radical SAM family heme chaperone HemW [Bryobacteraceae bacterium]|nr:radical SAM family heme chaperone HemW [Bryobacteraceae bacterium]
MAGVYVSYPFCAQKCTYCNFGSGVFPRDLESAYLKALEAELAAASWPWIPETIYIGGGTPSRMTSEALARILDLALGKPHSGGIEATIEAAPGGLTPALAQGWLEAGINRVSFGVQSFDSRELARTGRQHDAATVAAEVAIVRSAGFQNFNVDLIAGLPGQTLRSWTASLDWIERLEAPHVSIYMLEVDEDSRLGAEVLASGKRYGAADVPTDDAIADFYELAVARLAAMGIRRYEISNFALPGWESRHNLKYWRREPYLGFGADAHSFDGATRWQNVESVREYVERLAQGLSPAVARSAADSAEAFFLGLRLDAGIEADWSPYRDAVERLLGQGLLETQGRRLRLTRRGVLLSNEVFAEFI